MAIISVKNLSKRYRIGVKEEGYDTIVGSLANIIRRPIQNMRKLRSLSRLKEDDDSVFWALKDVSFDIEQGEVVGIIGSNGAGKSTLLKILSRITLPTSGSVTMRGRIGSLLEVGTGFHPELTGRENVYLNGTILGMSRQEITRRFDEIVDFSGVEKFIDTPIKRYSSGMQVRLAFAVAAHLEPEILIIDEVLSVGDAEFQRKSIGKMHDVAGSGRTVIFVSHNMNAVKSLTHKCIYLQEGQLIDFGITDKMIHLYSKQFVNIKEDDSNKSYVTKYIQTVKDNSYGVRFKHILINGQKLKDVYAINMGNAIDFELQIESNQFVGEVYINALFKDHVDRHIIFMTSLDKDSTFKIKNGVNSISFSIKCLPLTPGIYYANIDLRSLNPDDRLSFIVSIPLLDVHLRDDINYAFNRPWGAIQLDDIYWHS